jgi:hypothetical protein
MSDEIEGLFTLSKHGHIMDFDVRFGSNIGISRHSTFEMNEESRVWVGDRQDFRKALSIWANEAGGDRSMGKMQVALKEIDMLLRSLHQLHQLDTDHLHNSKAPAQLLCMDLVLIFLGVGHSDLHHRL